MSKTEDEEKLTEKLKDLTEFLDKEPAIRYNLHSVIWEIFDRSNYVLRELENDE